MVLSDVEKGYCDYDNQRHPLGRWSGKCAEEFGQSLKSNVTGCSISRRKWTAWLQRTRISIEYVFRCVFKTWQQVLRYK